MRGTDLLNAMELVDPVYVEVADRTPRKRKTGWAAWGAIAACFCLVAVAALSNLQSYDVPAPPDSTQTTPPHITQTPDKDVPGSPTPVIPDWTVHYNEPTGSLDAARKYIPGYFTEELSQQELAAVTPPVLAEGMTLSGRAGFDGDGNLLEVFLNVSTCLPDTSVSVTVTKGILYRDYVLPDDPVSSFCNGVEYRVYQSGTDLDADAEIGGYTFQFSMNADAAQPEQSKAVFEQVLASFAHFESNGPDLSVITPEAIPEYFSYDYSLNQAQNDPDFGTYFLQSTPSGYVEESIRRYKDQTSNSLSGLWCKGYDDLRWKVSFFTEADAARVTSVADTVNYDLSFYPIPRADSVPEELREIVDNPIFLAEELTLDAVRARAYPITEAGDCDGLRMAFSVKYGDILVEVRADGLDPEWVYHQLINLI